MGESCSTRQCHVQTAPPPHFDYHYYHCVRAFITETNLERITDMVEFFPHSIPLPETSNADYLKQAADNILAILKEPKPTLPFLNSGETMHSAVEQTATLLNRAIKRTHLSQKIHAEKITESVVQSTTPSTPTPTPTNAPDPRVVEEDDDHHNAAPRVQNNPSHPQPNQPNSGLHLIQHLTPSYQPFTDFKLTVL